MAFKKINPSSVSELLLEVVNFCKNDLNWAVAQQSVTEYKFQPFAGAETFTIKDVVQGSVVIGLTGTTYPYNQFTIQMGNYTTYISQCGMIVGFVNAWLKGDADNFMCVIETTPRNFRWFGFGEVKKPVPTMATNIAWSIGSHWSDAFKTVINGASYMKDPILFGMNAAYNPDGFSEYYSGNRTGLVKYDGVYYTDCIQKQGQFGGGIRSFLNQMFMTNANNKYLGGTLLAKMPLFIRPTNNVDLTFLCEMPLWYAAYVENDICPLETIYGGKRYIVFNVGSNNKNVDSRILNDGNAFRNFPELNPLDAIRVRSGNYCFALCMDD